MNNINNLIVTQCGIRSRKQISEMISFIRDGGIFSKDTMKLYDPMTGPIISISDFGDGDLYIHDGLHRIVSVLLSGKRDFLFPEEFVIRKWKYEQYLEINHNVGWVTPFDPRTEIRLPDFGTFKKHVKWLYDNQSPDHATHFILTHKNDYAKIRDIRVVTELLEKFWM